MATYVRRFPRDSYEGLLVEALVACGFELTLSSDLEDEVFGIDAWDTEYEVPWDFYIGNGRNGRFAEKLAKAQSNRVAVLHIPATVIDDLCFASSRGSALLWITELYDEALSSVRGQLKTRVEVGAEIVRWSMFHEPRLRTA